MFEVRLHNRLGMRTGARALLACLVFALFIGLHAPAQAAAGTVTNTNDSGAGSLRMAIEEATAGEAIEFEGLNGQTITLTTGAIAIDESLEIIGPGASQLTVDGGGAGQIFAITEGNVSISGLTLANGVSPEDGGAIEATGPGSLTISDSTFEGNEAGGDGGSEDLSGEGHGGAIYVSPSASSLVVDNGTFIANSSGGDGGDGSASGRGRGGAIDYSGNGTLTVTGSMFSDNETGGDGGSDQQSGLGRGGAIFVAAFAASASISDSTFTGNTGGGDGGSGFLSGRGEGGAIKGDSGTGPMTVTDSTFNGNAVGGMEGGTGAGVGSGGAINSFSGLTVTDSTFEGNAAGGQGEAGSGGSFGFGGAINNFNNVDPLTVTGSTFVANTAGGDGGTGNGGAISASDVSPRKASITNSTLIGNMAGGGGAAGHGGAVEVKDLSSLTLASVTIDQNVVGSGGSGAGINSATGAIGQPATVTAKATIVSGNTGAANCDAAVASSSYSLEGPSETSCGFDLASADPLLEPLADNGGPTETQALPQASPAVDTVPAVSCPTSVDQRGEPRPDNGKAFCDVGAYELQDPPIAPTITSGAVATFQVGEAGSFTVEATGLPIPFLSREGTLPAGVAFTDNGDGTASLAGTPVAGAEGSYPLTIKAANGTSPDAAQNFTLTVMAPEPPGDSGGPPKGPDNPKGPPVPRIDLSLGVERPSLRQLRRSGRLIVAVKVNRAATVALSGWAKLGDRARSSARLARLLRPRTVRFGQAGQRKVALALTRRGRRVLRRLPKVRLVIVGRAVDNSGARTRSKASVLLTSRPGPVVLYRQEGGIGNPRPSLVVLGNRWTRVSLGHCRAKFRLPRSAWRRLRVALRSVDIGAIAGDYPPPSGAADLITYVVKTSAGTVRVTPASRPDDEEVMRALRPLLNVLDRTVAIGERRMPSSCKSNRSQS